MEAERANHGEPRALPLEERRHRVENAGKVHARAGYHAGPRPDGEEAIGRLAGGVAHDFNNLLTVILGRAQLLLQRLPEADPLRRHAGLIQSTAERAGALTQQLLAFGRKQVLQPRVLDLNALVSDVKKIRRRLLGEELLTVLDPGLGRIKADPVQLEQVLINLAVNARDAMPRGGRLAIETVNVELDQAFVRANPGARPGSHVRLAVGDTGTGMDAEALSRIFEPFFTTKEQGKGTGLGLATVYGIVKQSDGYVGVETELGRGTTFSVYLPRATAEADAPAAGPSPAPPAAGSETILVAEDDESLGELARDVLLSCGYGVLEARDGTAALEVAARHPGPIHLLLTDVVMPGLNGRELADRVRALRPEARVLYLSGYSDEMLGLRGVLEPDITLLPKPFTPDALARQVRTLLDAPDRGGPRPAG
jgi:CheY-like chemotaxis protein